MGVNATSAIALEIEILQGEEAQRALSNGDFVDRWNDLFHSCTWSTAYLSVDYAIAWYRCYGDVYAPLLIRAFSADGRLAGILALGVSKDARTLVTVGTPRGEYSAWLARPESPELFIEAALDALSRQFPHAELKFRFLAPGAPIAWARCGEKWASRCIVLDADRPEMEIRPEAIHKSLSKRNNRNRLNRLRRSGQVEFRHITDVDALSSIIDAILTQHDLRSIALHGMPPARSDARTRDFYLRLMSCGKLHVTVSMIGEEVVAAIIGICDRETVHLELLCHSPKYSAYSPGKLHLLRLMEDLVAEGYKFIDLTPGDLLWKDRTATVYKSAHEVIVAFSRPALLKAQLRVLFTHRAKRVFKPVLSWLKIEPRMFKNAVRALRDEGLRSLFGKAIRTNSVGSGSSKLKQFYFSGVHEFVADDSLIVKKDVLQDLFLLDEKSDGLKRAFLRRAYNRLCSGASLFTYAEHGRLMGFCWVETIENHFEQEDAVSPACFLLCDPCYDSQADRSRLCLAFVLSIAHSCRSQAPDSSLKLCAKNSDGDLIAALEELRRESVSKRKQRVPVMSGAAVAECAPSAANSKAQPANSG
jgi:CelD/BcsL family acetyltransferase involved in cellulose biosynthesis